MGSRLKEDEKNEKIIRGLLKLPANRKCINCNMLGPQYVCTTFSTFICTTCSGIHREFTHRVKSVSMAKFTPQEIASLQAGGNERAREIYFKEWDPKRNFPDSNNVDRLRDFIKHAYVHRRYTGERSIDRPSQVDKEESNENRKSDAYCSQSPPYDDRSHHRYNDRASPGDDVRGSPGYDQDNRRYSDFGRSPGRSGVVNDWRREDRFLNGRKSEDRRSSDGVSRFEVRSPDSQRSSDISSPPMIRPVGDILGDNVVLLRIGEPPKDNGSRITDAPMLTQRTASSNSLASSNGNPSEVKRETSLIDFDAEPQPPVIDTATQAQPSTANQSIGQPTSTPTDDNWACFDNIQEKKVSQGPSSSNPLESVLLQSSLSASGPVSVAASSAAAPTPSNGIFPSSSGDLLFDSLANVSTVAFNGVPPAGAAARPASPLTLPVNGGVGQLAGMQHPQTAANQPAAARPFASSFPSGSSNHGVVDNPSAQASQAVEVKSSGRTELPADLFAATYFPVPYQASGWQAGLAPGMGYAMQYTAAMSMPTFPQQSKPSNPFDVAAQATPTQAAVFPSMSSLNAALPNLGPPTGVADSAIPPWISTQSSSYPSTVPPLAQPQPFASVMPGTYMGQELSANMAPSGPQGFGAFGSETTAFASLKTAAVTPSPSVGGNPFD